MEIRYKGKVRIFVLTIIGIVMVLSSYLIYLFDPINKAIAVMSTITEGSIAFRLWQKPSYEIFLKTYVFNITNAEAFLAGDDEKLKFEQIGPFTFQEILVNSNATFYKNGTMSYEPRRYLKFIPEQSIADPKDVVVTVPNVPLLGIASMLHQSSFMLNWAVTSIVNMLDSQPILELTVHDYLWGYNDTLVKTASSVLPNWIHFERFGILDRMLDEGENTVTMSVDPERKTGNPLIPEEERGRLYSILQWNGIHGLKQWGYTEPDDNETIPTNSKCNVLEGAYDGSIFPPNISEGAVFRLYRKLFCRTVPIRFDHAGQTKNGFDGYWFTILENFLDLYEDNPDNECYCTDKKFCLPKGFGDITPCYYGFPTAISQPHFLNSDPEILAKVEGLNPNEKDHGTSIVINPQMGVLMEGYSRMQINLVMRKSLQRRAKPFNDMIIPLFWSEMRVYDMPASIKFLITISQKIVPVLTVVLIYLLAIVGAILIATAGILVFISAGKVVQQSPTTLNIGYTAVRMIPISRKESLIIDNRRTKA